MSAPAQARASPMRRARAALREATIARLRAFLAANPPEGAERVILFGSLARGDFDGASDADLLLIAPGGTIDSGVFDAAGRDCDILQVTPTDWAAAQASGTPFARTVAAEGVLLWQAPG